MNESTVKYMCVFIIVYNTQLSHLNNDCIHTCKGMVDPGGHDATSEVGNVQPTGISDVTLLRQLQPGLQLQRIYSRLILSW